MKIKVCIFLVCLLLPLLANASNFENVALVSVSTQYDEQKLDKIKSKLEKVGYKVTDQYLHQVVSDLGYVDNDYSRAKNLINALLDDDVEVIWFVRGGGGGFNLIPYLYKEVERLKSAKPKVLIGFSDVTAIHSFVNEYLKWDSLHSVVASYNKDMKDPDDIAISTNDLEPLPNIANILKSGISYNDVIPLNDIANKGVTGELRGGNLTLVAASFATKFEPKFTDKVLLLEDVGTSFRQLDRSLQQILFMNKIDVNAIVFGQFYPLDPTDEQRLIYKSVIQRFADNWGKPVYYYPFIGHGRLNNPVILGEKVTITCDDEKVGYCNLSQK
ncbi:LD-carboxypeptidase [Vibrio sp. 10N.261.55.A7]|uniref:LD-carboxypeptidase n=1 Tax=Vibrio sp. 10N.261.55.A7 TaxID=1880851 RepID=UPI000C863F71|nr:LD-carboxypeptidase [Vibrio sp. 10N.261.55.A7]PMK03232.1 LD-carboxypeptidase [Vibrio sp. 10N.261.55.A7]